MRMHTRRRDAMKTRFTLLVTPVATTLVIASPEAQGVEPATMQMRCRLRPFHSIQTTILACPGLLRPRPARRGDAACKGRPASRRRHHPTSERRAGRGQEDGPDKRVNVMWSGVRGPPNRRDQAGQAGAAGLP